MRIGIIGTRGIPNNYGGFEQFAQFLSTKLADEDNEVFVYNSHNHSFKKSKWNNVNIIHKFDPEFIIGLSGQFLYDLACIIDSRKQNFDVILQLGYTTNAIWYFLLPEKSLKICNADGLEWQRAKYPSIIKRFLKFAEKLMVKSNHQIVADSKVIKDYFYTKYNIDTEYIAYPAKIFSQPDNKLLHSYGLKPFQYNLLIARLQIDNHIETIINGVLHSQSVLPLIIVGNCNTRYGKYLTKKYQNNKIVFLNSIYNQLLLNNIRYYSNYYFHGHSAGGTNPSLLEAMACSCLIFAHNNPFNKSVLQQNAFYFDHCNDISDYLNKKFQKSDYELFIKKNLKKIQEEYNETKIIHQYLDTIAKNIQKLNKLRIK